MQTETVLIMPSYHQILLQDPGGWNYQDAPIPQPEPGKPYAPVMAWADPTIPGSLYLSTASDIAKVWVTITVEDDTSSPPPHWLVVGAELALTTVMEFFPLPPNEYLRLMAPAGDGAEFRTIVVEPGFYTVKVLVAGREQARQAQDLAHTVDPEGNYAPHEPGMASILMPYEHFWIVLNRKLE
jgi:hypothetical protein